MKLSCLPVSFFGQIISGEMAVSQWARLAKAIGLDGIDLSILFFRNHDRDMLKGTREAIESEGISVAVFNTYPDLTHPDLGERKRQLRQLEADIGTAGLLGAEMVRVTAGQAHPETTRADGISWAVHGLTQALDAAKEHGVTLVFENHSKPGVWDYYDFCYPPDIFLEIAKGLSQTSMRILFDTANPVAFCADPVRLLERVVDRVSCVHVADIRQTGAFEPVLVGTGAVPFGEIFSLLHREGYEGWLSIEEASNLGESGIGKAVKFVRKAWALGN